jgi:hypothetical protein
LPLVEDVHPAMMYLMVGALQVVIKELVVVSINFLGLGSDEEYLSECEFCLDNSKVLINY